MVDLKIGAGGVIATPTRPNITPDASGNTAATGGSPSATPTKFAEVLRTANREQLDTELSALIDRVRQAGQKFLHEPEERTLDDYKKQMREFLGRAQREAFATREQSGFARDGQQQKLFQTVATVDTEVAGLTKDTLAQEDRQIRLLASLDDIRGMLLDVVT